LAAVAEALGEARINIEGGGLFAHAGTVVAHYLVADGDALAARTALREVAGRAGDVVVRDVRLLRLDQATPGTLARAARGLASGPALVAQYSDHAGNLVLVQASA
jgi:hypothetical protein